MKHFIQHTMSAMAAGKDMPVAHLRVLWYRQAVCRVALTILFLVFMSTIAFASHFKGGYFSYNYLGNGRYEFLITGYWEKSDVGRIFPRYEGSPKIHGFPLTVSKTLLSDGETVEHVQRQEVSWSNPGLYLVYWKTCCRAVGTNFNHNNIGLFAAVNYDPAALSSSPKFYDDRLLNFVSEQKINYTIQMEDPEGHEQEFSLEVPYGLPADVYSEMLETGFQIKKDGTMVWENPLEGEWLVSIKLREKIGGSFTGAYVVRDFIFNVSSRSNRPDWAGADHTQRGKSDMKGMSANTRSNAVFAGNLTLEAMPALAEVTVFPNPVTDGSQLKVKLEEADVVTIDIIDLTGRVVKQLYAGNTEANEELTFELNSNLGKEKFYICRLRTTKKVHSFKLIMK